MPARDIEQQILYCLEMTSRDDFFPSERTIGQCEFERVEIACPEFNWFLHEAVGAEFRWGSRKDRGRQEWTKYVDRSELETWVVYMAGTAAGYYELEKRDDGSVQIERLGLRNQFIGQGLGGILLTNAVERCREMGANRVWLETCNHDHPHALQNYLARGFRLANETTGPPKPPRASQLFALERRL